MHRQLSILVFLLLSWTAVRTCAQGLEGESFADEFVLENFLNEQVEVASFFEAAGCDVGCCGLIVGGREPVPRTQPGFRPFGRIALGQTAVEDFDAFADQLGEFGSAGIGAQHVWNDDWSLQSNRPAWRSDLSGAGYSLKAGWLPMADVRGMRAPKRKKAPNWWDEFKGVNYFGYGLEYKRLMSRFSNKAFFLSVAAGSTDAAYPGSLSAQDQTIEHIAQAKHSIIGPEFTLGRTASKGRWLVDVSGHLLLGYERVEGFQRVFSPEGGVVRFADSGANGAVTSGKEHFAQVAQLRLQCSYFVKEHWTFDLHWRGSYGGPFYDAWRSLRTPLNEDAFRIAESDSDYYSASSLGFGITYLR